MNAWLLAIRPKTLIASVSPVLIGTALAKRECTISWILFAAILLTACGIQIVSNLANDYIDYLKGVDTAERKGPVRVTQAGLIPVTSMRRATLFVILATACIGTYIVWKGGPLFALLLALSLALAMLYSAGPFPLSHLGISEFFVFLFFGPVATAGTFFLQTHHLSLHSFLAGIAPGALSAAILTLNNLRDIDEDRAAGKKTLIVRFGRKFGKIEYLSCLLLAGLTPLLFLQYTPLILSTMLFLVPAIPLARGVWSSRNLNRLFAQTALLLAIYTLFFCTPLLL